MLAAVVSLEPVFAIAGRQRREAAPGGFFIVGSRHFVYIDQDSPNWSNPCPERSRIRD